jgi:hypothetical protein
MFCADFKFSVCVWLNGLGLFGVLVSLHGSWRKMVRVFILESNCVFELLDAPSFRDLYQKEDHEGDDDEGYQRYEKVSDTEHLAEYFNSVRR